MQTFKLAHLNVRSLVAKFGEFERIVREGDYDVVAVTETWLNGSIGSELIRVPGYSLVRRDRPSRGGGVAIYFKSNLHVSHAGDLSLSNPYFEAIWISLKLKKKRLYYRLHLSSTLLYFG